MAAKLSDDPSSNRFGSIIDYIADPIFVKDRKHRWVYLNKAYCEFMGYGKKELLGKTDYDFFSKAEADIFWAKDEIVFNTKTENVNEENFTDSKGLTHIIMTKKMLFKAEDGGEFIVGVIRDITELKRMDVELRNKVHELETFNKSAVDRELKMIELKDKVKSLELRLKK